MTWPPRSQRMPRWEPSSPKLSNSMQRYHVDTINAAKSVETRERRIGKAVSLFREGKQR